ncbi:hypothetical protein QFC21_002130 [Naganishia friedmannii]|uniref:Uncharacterized protein n=1 Tax=Naganishia friedmannii TaxID=89922 RepID=A0ACC2VZ71_9TREE|nr:hypothetical protein QFC21_002130 [Naganishia friedmannii]
MTVSAACRNAWISTGFKLRPVSTQLQALASPRRLLGRSSTRGVSSSHSPRAEAEGSDPEPPVSSPSSEAPLAETPTHTASTSNTSAPPQKSKAPESLKDIFPDLFGDLKPTTSEPITRVQRKDWEHTIDASIRDPQSKVDVTARRTVRSSSSTLGLGSKLSSILDMGSNTAGSNRNRLSPAVYGTKDRTRPAPKELQAFHELLESMFEASEARGSQVERIQKRDGRGDSYLSDSMLGRPRLNRRHRDEATQVEYQDKHNHHHRITTIAKPIGGMKNITDTEWDEFLQQKEVIASLRTDLDILEWLKISYFPTTLSTTASSDTLETDETAATFSSIYPLVLAHTISILHVRFRNPQAAVAVFNTARSHSLESYLVGCTTSVYNNMLRARWEGLGDLKGVEEGLEEMGRRGVGWDKETMRLANTLVENLVKIRLSSPYDNAETHVVSNDQRLVWAYGPDVFARLARLEEMVESQVEFVEHKSFSAARRRADEALEKEMGGAGGYAQQAGQPYAARGGESRSWSESLRPAGHA